MCDLAAAFFREMDIFRAGEAIFGSEGRGSVADEIEAGGHDGYLVGDEFVLNCLWHKDWQDVSIGAQVSAIRCNPAQ